MSKRFPWIREKLIVYRQTITVTETAKEVIVYRQAITVIEMAKEVLHNDEENSLSIEKIIEILFIKKLKKIFLKFNLRKNDFKYLLD